MNFGQRLIVCAAVALLAAGCGQGASDEYGTDRPAGAPADRPAASTPGSQTTQPGASNEVRSMGGELGSVNTDQQTFVVMVDGKDQTFRFSDATQVSGASGTQGLAGRTGARVTVYYRDSGGMRIADRIILTTETTPLR